MRFLEVIFKNIVEQKLLLHQTVEPLAPVRHRLDESALFNIFFFFLNKILIKCKLGTPSIQRFVLLRKHGISKPRETTQKTKSTLEVEVKICIVYTVFLIYRTGADSGIKTVLRQKSTCDSWNMQIWTISAWSRFSYGLPRLTSWQNSDT